MMSFASQKNIEDTQLLTTVVIGITAINLFSSFLSFIQSNLIAHFAQRLELGLVLEFGRSNAAFTPKLLRVSS